MKSFIEVRNETLRREGSKIVAIVSEQLQADCVGDEELWQEVATKGEHEAWFERGYGMVAYFNTQSEFCNVATYRAQNEDGTLVVLDRDYYSLPGYLYVLAG